MKHRIGLTRRMWFVGMVGTSVALASAVVSALPPAAPEYQSCCPQAASTVSPRDAASTELPPSQAAHPNIRVTPNVEALRLTERARLQYRGGEMLEARASIQAARRLDPWQIATYQLEARIARDLGDRRQYVAALESIVKANPHSATANNAAGILLVGAGEIECGVTAQEKACLLAPHTMRFARDLAATYVSRGHAATAAELLEEARAHHEKDTSLAIALARLNESEGRWKDAANYYRLAAQASQYDLFWQKQEARCLYRIEDFDGAVKAFSVSLDLRQTPSGSLAEFVEYGDACLRVGKPDLAGTVFDFVSRHSAEKSKDVELLRALCAIQQQKVAAAKTIVDSALESWPDDADLQTLAGLCRSELDEVSPAAAQNDDAEQAGAGRPRAGNLPAVASTEGR